jgi:hypothetical protein
MNVSIDEIPRHVLAIFLSAVSRRGVEHSRNRSCGQCTASNLDKVTSMEHCPPPFASSLSLAAQKSNRYPMIILTIRRSVLPVIRASLSNWTPIWASGQGPLSDDGREQLLPLVLEGVEVDGMSR